VLQLHVRVWRFSPQGKNKYWKSTSSTTIHVIYLSPTFHKHGQCDWNSIPHHDTFKPSLHVRFPLLQWKDSRIFGWWLTLSFSQHVANGQSVVSVIQFVQDIVLLCLVLFGSETRGVCHTVALPLTLKSILRQMKNYGNSNISPCKNIIFKKNSSKRN
jgi:hypothetical protein